jgi:hypothetical protein
VHAPAEDKSDDSQGTFYKELEQVFNFKAELGTEDIFKPTTGNEHLL